jgi:crossover junction endodeoxyribonuclease RuvC
MGLDPGYGRMGFGVIRVKESQPEIIDYGVSTTTAGDTVERRLLCISDDLNELFAHHQPGVVAIEKIFFGKSAKTAINVAQARGVALEAAARAGVKVIEFTPAQIKMALTGDGKADKAAVQRMIKELLRLPQIPRPDDAADALAVAITASAVRW